MAGTEGVVDVGVDPLDQRGDELRIVALLARVEAQVLHQLDAGRELGEARPDGIHRVLRVRLTLGTTEM